jgi:hypothetical protein
LEVGPVKLEYLQQADAILTKCGRPLLPGGISAVPFPKAFLMPMVLQSAASTTFTKEITGDVPWEFRAISCDSLSATFPGTQLFGLRILIQLPNGRFLQGGNGVDIGEFSYLGSWKWLQDPPLLCQPGSRFNVTLTDTTAAGLGIAVAINLLMEGAYLYYLKGGQRTTQPYPDVASWPRYRGDLNENILAPVWMANEAIYTPPGFQDDYFIYSTPDPLDNVANVSWTVTAGAITARPQPFTIQMDQGYDMYVTRILADISYPTGTATGNIVARLRTGAGYALNDNFVNIMAYLCGAEFGTPWKIDAGDTVFIDANLVDTSSTGTVAFRVFLEGYRRSKA